MSKQNQAQKPSDYELIESFLSLPANKQAEILTKSELTVHSRNSSLWQRFIALLVTFWRHFWRTLTGVEKIGFFNTIFDFLFASMLITIPIGFVFVITKSTLLVLFFLLTCLISVFITSSLRLFFEASKTTETNPSFIFTQTMVPMVISLVLFIVFSGLLSTTQSFQLQILGLFIITTAAINAALWNFAASSYIIRASIIPER